MNRYHRHHILPKHMGGTDAVSNLVMLSVEEHAEAHKKLYEEFGRWQDKIAWQGLSGIIGHEEAVFAAQSLAGESRRGENTHFYGKTHSEETKRKISNTKRGRVQSVGEKVNQIEAQLGKKQKIVECPHCGKMGGNATMPRWHFDQCKFK